MDPNHATDNSSSVLIGDDLEVQGEAFIGDAADYVKMDEEGITLAGKAQVWKSDDLVPGTIGHPSTNPPDSDDYQGWVYDRFDDTTEEQVFHKWHIPNDFATGTASVRGHFAGMVANEDGLKYVAMGFQWYKRTPGQTFDFTTDGADGGGAVNITIANTEGDYVWHESQTGVCDTTGWAADDTIFFRFFRDVDDVYTAVSDHDDDYVGDVFIGVYHLEYLANKLGAAT